MAKRQLQFFHRIGIALLQEIDAPQFIVHHAVLRILR